MKFLLYGLIIKIETSKLKLKIVSDRTVPKSYDQYFRSFLSA